MGAIAGSGFGQVPTSSLTPADCNALLAQGHRPEDLDRLPPPVNGVHFVGWPKGTFSEFEAADGEW